MHHRTVFEAKAAHLVRCGPSTGLGAVVTEGNAALSDRPHERVVNLSHAFHYTAPSLVSSVGSVGLGRALEASGAGSCFGVAPSTSRWPSAWTITLVNVICADAPPLDSASVASCVGVGKIDANNWFLSMTWGKGTDHLPIICQKGG